MKKILFLLMLLGLSYFLNAQVHADFGVKGGINLANMKVENSSTPDMKVAMHAGVLADFHLDEHWVFQPELVYSAQGYKEIISGTEYKLRLHYINIPLLLQYRTGTGFRAQTGPQIGILAGAQSKTGNVEVNINDRYKTFDLSWAFGGSYVFSSGLGVDARYNLGITDFNDTGGGNSIKNRVWQFGIFYQFNVSSASHK